MFESIDRVKRGLYESPISGVSFDMLRARSYTHDSPFAARPFASNETLPTGWVEAHRTARRLQVPVEQHRPTEAARRGSECSPRRRRGCCRRRRAEKKKKKNEGGRRDERVSSTSTCETTLGHYSITHQHLAEVFTIRRLFRCRDGALHALSAPPDLLSRLGQIELQCPEVVDDGIVGFASQDLGRQGRRRRDGLTGAQELFARRES